MKFNKIMTGLAVLMVAGSAMSAYAADDAKPSTDTAKVTFVGAIVDTPCSLADGSDEQTVKLGHVAKHVLQEGDKHSDAVDFSFKLTNCTPSNKVTLTFQGPADPNSSDASLLALGGGTASGAGIAIMDQGKEIALGKPTAQYQLAEGDNTLTFSAYVKGDGASEITTGDFTSVATALFTYN